MDQRKVIDVVGFEEGENQGTNILFTMQYAMMQQMGALMHSAGLKKGFDLITWYNMNEFLELRNKLLALKTYFRFDPRTQRLILLPEPKSTNFGRYYGLVRCYVERRVRDLIKEIWVQKYALALSKIGVGTVRGKYNGVQLLGQGTINWDTMLTQGISERDSLEEQCIQLKEQIQKLQKYKEGLDTIAQKHGYTI